MKSDCACTHWIEIEICWFLNKHKINGNVFEWNSHCLNPQFSRCLYGNNLKNVRQVVNNRNCINTFWASISSAQTCKIKTRIRICIIFGYVIVNRLCFSFIICKCSTGLLPIILSSNNIVHTHTPYSLNQAGSSNDERWLTPYTTNYLDLFFHWITYFIH